MKNKKLNYALLPAVLCVWMLVIFQWKKGTAHAPIESKQEHNWMFQADSQLIIPELSLVYPDPFLREKWHNPTQDRKNPTAVVWGEVPATLPTERWKYKGAIRQMGQLLALVEVNGISHYLEVGKSLQSCVCEQVDPVRLVLVCHESSFHLSIGKDTLL